MKKKALIFEDQHPLGRFCDLDVYDKEGHPVSSGIKKKCYLCEQPAWFCIKSNNHSYEELNLHITKTFQNYILQKKNRDIADRLSRLAEKALKEEVALAPKPGLVTRFDSGPHNDMDYDTFVRSASVLRSGFYQMVMKALDSLVRDESHLVRIRSVGLEMEKEMFRITKGVNTHKGAIFLMGLAVYASALCIKEKSKIDYSFIQSLVRQITSGISLELDNDSLGTHGQNVYRKYGFKGARGQAESGLPIVFDDILPFAQNLAELGFSKDDFYNALLVRIIAKNDDSNVLYRGDTNKLICIKSIAKKIIKSNFWTSQARSLYSELCNYCNINNLSCGGSADLLAVSIYCLEMGNGGRIDEVFRSRSGDLLR